VERHGRVLPGEHQHAAGYAAGEEDPTYHVAGTPGDDQGTQVAKVGLMIVDVVS
jgi:hypothetical protein